MEEQQKKDEILKNALNYPSKSIRKRKGTIVSNSRGSSNRDGKRKQPLKVSEYVSWVHFILIPFSFIKNRIISENLHQRKREYIKKIEQYKINNAQYEKNIKSRAAIEEARKNLEKFSLTNSGEEVTKFPLSTRSNRSRPSS